MARICPVCRIPLQQAIIRPGLVIDTCNRCRGLWFDRGEFQQAYHYSPHVSQVLMGKPSPERDVVICPKCGKKNLRSQAACSSCGAKLRFLCPVCRKQMQEVAVNNVWIDRCNQCQGIWLDGGELELLFNSVKQRKQQEVHQARQHGEPIPSDLAAWAAIEALDTLIWTPDLVYHTGKALAHGATHVPGLVADGVGAAFEAAQHAPEIAGNVAEGAVALASHSAELAGNVAEGAIHLVGELPEAAGAVAEAAGSFIEMIFELISSLFDQ